MEGNQTQTEFILLGITDSPLALTPLFVLFLLIYIVTLVGNFGIIILVRVSPSLHTPMYFFLTHFAFIDICYSTVISPRLLADLLSEDKTISFSGCMMQFLTFAFFAISECHLLAMMAYDRHVAICQPLLYVTIISRRVCWQLVASSYLFAFPSAIIFTWCVFGGSFCGPNRIDHFFCDVVPVLKLVCSDMHNSELMAWENWTTVTEFVFKGFTDCLDFQVTLFVLFLLIYVTTVIGNLGIIAAVWLDSQLQSPMYFFLSHLSFLDLCYSSVVTLKMLLNLLSERKTISFAGCFLQLYIYAAFAVTECYLLAGMAYDRYVAICNPLHYPILMTKKVCVSLLAGSYAVGLFNSTIFTGFALRVLFCGRNVIDHFFCNGPPLSKLACSDTSLNQVLLFAFGGFSEVATISVILISYGHILFTIMRTGSVLGKAFGTCESHLVVVTIFYGTLIFMYLRPSSSYNLGRDKIVSVFYTTVTPMLNLFIYSLRNKEIKSALKRTVGRMIISLPKW
ncbi:olfactory receptor 5AR1-like [Pezoporus occidentalis]|uniref:olfactory receptor 5AR1-like n=1 Tax=Pezoporus occidentalis TaxID=407982 RepID=UPI002F917132